MQPTGIIFRNIKIRVCFVAIFLLVLDSLLMRTETATNTDTKDSDSLCPVIPNYDVFVNFHSPDTSDGFLRHTDEAFTTNKILAFIDNKLHKGDEILPSLIKAIETSFISLVIFSQNYASSAWCLDELVKIVQCRKKDGQILMPVFYRVDPITVRHQKGTYANAFAEHEKRHDLTRVQQWRSALNESAKICGYHSSKFPDDAALVEEIVNRVLRELDRVKRINSKGLVGINKQISHVESLLQTGSKDIRRAIGIWGMNGMGKTTIAEEVYSRLRSDSDYESCYFKAHVREESRRHGIMSLKEELFSKLLGEQDLKIDTPDGLPDSVKRKLTDKKVLFVLDDVNDLQQLETLIGSKLDLFGNGSRIIITSRDKQVLVRVDDIYEVKPLEFNDSLRLFNINAFEKNHTNTKEYKELAKMMVKYAEGIPLVLKVLGRLLRRKDKEVWEDYLGRFRKNIPIKIVHQIFRSSYNDLDRHEKKIFLDIGCFFNGLSLKVDDIQLLVKDHDYSMCFEFESLKNKALITISPLNVVSMHNIIKQSALEIVREESNGDYEKQSRLLDPDDIYYILKNNKGSEAIRSLAIDVSIIKELQLHPKVFAKMNKLQYLDIYSKEYSRDFVESRRGLYFPQGLESFPNELRYLRWAHFPFGSLPSNFSGEKLVVLDLQYSNLTQLWHEDYKVKQYASAFAGSSSLLLQDLANLKYLKLDSSSFLVEFPDLSNATNLEVIDLRLCTRLKSVHPSVFTLNKLKKLDLGGCFSLESFKSDIHLTSLRYLSLASCSALKECSVTSKEMVILNLERTGIKQLPSSIKLQTKLEKLLLAHSYIENLPESIKNLTSLRHLGLQNCSKLRSLPELPPSLIILDASGCVSLENVDFPSTAHQMLKENKTRVAFWNCLKLNQRSLNAVRLNAQINMMKFTHHHISMSRDHDYDAQSTYVYPGSNVPEWLLYRTTHDKMTIDLSFGNHSSPLGFIFCFIVPQVPSQGFILRFNIEIDEGEEDIQLYLDRPRQEIRSDHVCLIYYRSFSRYLNSRVKDRSKFKIKVTAESRTLTTQYVPLLPLKGFGVSPINTSRYLNFVQHTEMADGPSILLSSSISIVNILLLLVFIVLVIRMFAC